MNPKLIVNELKELIRKNYPDEPSRIILYGSTARAEASADSDIDILIIFNTSINVELKNFIYELCSSLNLKYDVWIDVNLLSSDDMKTIRGRQPFVQNALRDGITL